MGGSTGGVDTPQHPLNSTFDKAKERVAGNSVGSQIPGVMAGFYASPIGKNLISDVVAKVAYMNGNYDKLILLAKNGNQYAAQYLVQAVKSHIKKLAKLDGTDPKYLQKVVDTLGSKVFSVLQTPQPQTNPKSRSKGSMGGAQNKKAASQK